MDFDVIICGAGPAGATAAAYCAEAGLKTALIEKEFLPRHKTCGGGMPMTVKNYIRNIEPKAFIESDVRYMQHSWKFKDPLLVPINHDKSKPEISLWMVQRAVFDNALTNLAVKSGALLYDGLAVYTLEIEKNKVKVFAKSKNGNYEKSFIAKADYVIGADGANGIIGRLVNLRKNKVLAYGMEIEHHYDWKSSHNDLRKDVIYLEYGAINGGYAWIFPKNEHLNVGAGIFAPHSEWVKNKTNPKDLLQKTILNYLDSLNVKYDFDDMKFHAHPLPMWNGKETLNTEDGKIMLIGDAGGLISPLFGDGILHAIKSGNIAGQCVVNKTTKEYTRIIHEHFAANHDAARKLVPLFYKFSGLVYKHIIKRPAATRIAAELLCGNALFTDAVDTATKRMSGFIPKVSLEVQ